MKFLTSLSLSFLLSTQGMAQLQMISPDQKSLGLKSEGYLGVSEPVVGPLTPDPYHVENERRLKQSLVASDDGQLCHANEHYILTKGVEDGFIRSNSLILNFLSCENYKKLPRKDFNYTNCQLAVNCAASVYKEKFLVEMKSENLLDEAIAKDHVISSLTRYSSLMEDYDVMLKYVEEKYGIKNKEEACGSRFVSNSKGASCNRFVLEDAFERFQESCTGGSACFSKSGDGLKSYAQFKDTHKSLKVSYMSDFFTLKANKRFEDVQQRDGKAYSDLIVLIESEVFKKASKVEKVKSFIDKIGYESIYSKKLNDPIFKIVFQDLEFKTEKEIMRDPRAKEFFEFITSSSLTPENFAKKYDEYRKDLAEKFLKNNRKQCSRVPSIQDICSDATKIVKEKRLRSGEFNIVNSTPSRFLREVDLTKQLNELLGIDLKVEDQDILLYARKCTVYGYNFGGEKPQGKLELAASQGGAEEFDPVSDEAKSEKGYVAKTAISSGKGNSYTEGIEDEMAKSLPYDEKLAVNPNHALQPGQAQQALPNYMDMYGNSFIDKTEEANNQIKQDKKAKSEAESASSQDQGDFLNEKMFGLMKKLADAESKLQNLKETQKGKGADSSEADAATKLEMANLQKEIAGLKKSLANTEKAKKEQEALEATIASNTAKANNASNYSLGGSKGDSGSKSGYESHESGGRSSSGPSGSSSFDDGGVSRAPSSSSSSLGAIFSSNNDSAGPRSSLLASGAILTTVEGMAPEVATKTITSKIMELNGESFLIKQDGLIKEIKPLIKDGKVVLDENGNPVYETIIKGKATDEAFAEVLDTNVERKPQSITEVGDLKRAEEEKLKRQRAEYIKLKEVLKGVHKPK